MRQTVVDLSKEKPIRLKEVATLFGVHRRTVENWIERGLDARRMGKLIVTTMEEIQRFSQPVHVCTSGVGRIEADTSAADAAAAMVRRRFKV